MNKTQRKSQPYSKRLKSAKVALIYINFSFDFLGVDKVYFENNFPNQLTR